MNEHLHLWLITTLSLIGWCSPGSDTILINSFNSVVSFPSFSLMISYFLPADVTDVASPSGLQVAFSAVMWFHVPAAAANSILPHCQRVWNTHKDYFPTFSHAETSAANVNWTMYLQLADIKKPLLWCSLIRIDLRDKREPFFFPPVYDDGRNW